MNIKNQTNLAESTLEAVKEHNLFRINCICDTLRFQLGMDYFEIQAWFKTYADLEPDDFEDLMQDIDSVNN